MSASAEFLDMTRGVSYAFELQENGRKKGLPDHVVLAFHRLLVNDVPLHTRLVIAPSTAQLSIREGTSETVLLGDLDYLVCAVKQGAWGAHCMMTLGSARLHVAYDPASDDVMVRSVNHKPVHFQRHLLKVKAERKAGGPSAVQTVQQGEYVRVTPGHWVISSHESFHLANVWLLPRSFMVYRNVSSVPIIGQKRLPANAVGLSKKRRTTTGTQIVDSRKLSNQPPEDTAKTDQGNCLLTLGLGQTATMTLKKRRHSRAADERSEKSLVAVKILRSSRASSLHERARIFDNEVKMTRGHNHENIVGFHGADARCHAIFLEYYDHPNLASYTSPLTHLYSGTIEDTRAPQNILYTPGQPPILIDFGAAGPEGSTPDRGTALYRAPEYAFGEYLGFGSDIFSLGVTGLFLLRLVMLPEKYLQVWDDRHGSCDGSESGHGPDLDDWQTLLQRKWELMPCNGLRGLVKGALAPTAVERYSAREMAEVLEDDPEIE
ncbi:kinase-like domain-containing protein [Emericellopsis atlantica]|uniref:Autophagy-related protein 1 n=1 Tax=Emericellopsis atlantica TaxID=2614577 RepID=A0A9P7ZJ51_9HYPO|nr:kinase-like domain-containing protein [Emericellopsis atlantica]KAG9253069.1 kinase-like domain-containing protein [Emericellopsis atlantica]